MSEYLELGPVPTEEDCVSVEPSGDYLAPMRVELARYRDKLKFLYPDADLRIKMFQHDFGSYGEVVVYYEPGEASEERAYFIEANLPEKW